MPYGRDVYDDAVSDRLYLNVSLKMYYANLSYHADFDEHPSVSFIC